MHDGKNWIGLTEGNPQDLIATAPMSSRQVVAVALCVLLNALDGFDVLSISFASPGIAAEWGINRAALGIVLSMELIGMAMGSIVLGWLCDRMGRRPTILACLVLMATGMGLAAIAASVVTLSGFRLLTGIGIGGMLAATNAATAEHANVRHRNLAVALMAGGYPLGAVVGGAVASHLLVDHGWRAVFAVGGLASIACVPLVLWLLPETVAFLSRRRPDQALERVNRVLLSFGRTAVGTLAALDDQGQPHRSVRQILGPALRRTTVCVTLAYVAQILTFYFILKWVPKVVVDMGFAPAAAGGVLVWANLGGLAGSIALSLLARKLPLRWLTVGGMLLSTVLVALFGRSAADLGQLSELAAIAGFFTNAGIVGLYAILAAAFPTEVRGTATGFVIGIGRGGAALSPVLAGSLFQAGFGLPAVSLLMGLGSIVAAGALIALGRDGARQVPG